MKFLSTRDVFVSITGGCIVGFLILGLLSLNPRTREVKLTPEPKIATALVIDRIIYPGEIIYLRVSNLEKLDFFAYSDRERAQKMDPDWLEVGLVEETEEARGRNDDCSVPAQPTPGSGTESWLVPGTKRDAPYDHRDIRVSVDGLDTTLEAYSRNHRPVRLRNQNRAHDHAYLPREGGSN